LVVQCLDQAIQGRLLRLASTIEADSSTLGGQGKAPSLSQRGRTQPSSNTSGRTSSGSPVGQS
jgi:hypothetical protein